MLNNEGIGLTAGVENIGLEQDSLSIQSQ